MRRRDFLKAACAAPLLPFAFPAGETYVHPRFGRYVRHLLNRDVHWDSMGHKRYALFPIEVTLDIEFERGRARWVNFNCSQDLQNRMGKMSPEELLRGPTDDEGSLVFGDPVSVVDEMEPGRFPSGPYPHKKAKFRPAGEWRC